MSLKEKVKKIKFILKGFATYLPRSISKYLPSHQHQFSGQGVRDVGNSDIFAKTIYSTWLRFLISLQKAGINPNFESIAEIGPGDSLGLGLAALISGSKKYYALDVVETAFNYQNEEVFEELIKLFKNREPIPYGENFLKSRPQLDDYSFPGYILTEEKLNNCLSENRLNKIRSALKKVKEPLKVSNNEHNNIEIIYSVPWNKFTLINRESVDLIFSNAVMEHVDNLFQVYQTASLWAKKQGVMCHVIDFKSHGTAALWNGHWTYSNIVWKLIRGRCHYFINREPYSAHLKFTEKFFQIIKTKVYTRPNMLKKSDLSDKFRNLSEIDLTTSEAFIVSQKK